jgi:hypothetical protein
VSGDYLWDGSGDPDPEIGRLETDLQRLRGRRRPLDPGRLAALGPVSATGRWPALAAAAAVLLAVAAALSRAPGPDDGWELQWLAGPSWGDTRVVREEHLDEGRWIETGVSERARLSVGEIGLARLEPATRVLLVDRGRRAHRLSLARGTLHAIIWAPPGRFLVDTPAAVAVDLGCSYTLEVDDAGSGLLRVETGWVGFEHQDRLSLVPAGALCPMRRGHGPGTPRYETASSPFAAALDVVDFGSPGRERDDALSLVLAAARPRDALSLWHLLSRVDGADRGHVFDGLARLVPPPAEVTREGILDGSQAMRDLWWDELGLGSAEFWRDWTTGWTGAGGPSDAAAHRRAR